MGRPIKMVREHFFKVGDQVTYKKGRKFVVVKAEGHTFHNAVRNVSGMLITIEPIEGGRRMVVAEHDCSLTA